MGKPEAAVENHFCKIAGKHGYMTYKFHAIGIAGVPDRIAIGHGNVLFVELKAPGEEPRKLQKLAIQKMLKHGAKVFVIDSKADVDALFQTLEGTYEDDPGELELYIAEKAQSRGILYCKYPLAVLPCIPTHLLIKNGQISFLFFLSRGRRVTKAQKDIMEQLRSHNVKTYIIRGRKDADLMLKDIQASHRR